MLCLALSHLALVLLEIRQMAYRLEEIIFSCLAQVGEVVAAWVPATPRTRTEVMGVDLPLEVHWVDSLRQLLVVLVEPVLVPKQLMALRLQLSSLEARVEVEASTARTKQVGLAEKEGGLEVEVAEAVPQTMDSTLVLVGMVLTELPSSLLISKQ